MTTTLPSHVVTYLLAVDRDDVDAALGCLATAATVIDEGNTYQGEDLHTWHSSAGREFSYTKEFRNLRALDTTHFEADYHLEGNFPGGVIDLTYHFTTTPEGLIEHLDIAPNTGGTAR